MTKANSLQAGSANMDVIVVGAGAAGLGAAYALHRVGLRVAVIEARARIGGRVLTDRDSMDIPVELGAELVHGDERHNALWSVLRDRGIGTAALRAQHARLNPTAPWLDAQDEGVHRFPQGTPAVDRPVPAPCVGESAEAYLERLGIDRSNYPLSLLLTLTDDEQPGKLAAEDIATDVRRLLERGAIELPREETPSDDHRVPAGYDTVLEAIAEDLDIRLSTVVTHIADHGDRVTVDVAAEGGSARFSCRDVIVTVPMGVLLHGDIAFSPPLPEPMLDALRRRQNLPVCKLLMAFDTAVLPQGVDELIDFSCNPNIVWNAGAGHTGYSGRVVVGWATGDRARALLDLPETERFAAMLDTVRRMTDDDSLQYRTAMTHDWESDPFSRGSYGFEEGDDACIYRPHGHIRFAGVTMPRVDLAYATGLMAARKLLARDG